MHSQSFKAILIIVGAALLAIYLGVAVATDQTAAISWVVAALGIAFVLAMGRHIWVIIPCSLAMVGSINAIPGSPPAWMLATGVVQTVYILRFLMRKVPISFSFTIYDFAILLQWLAIAQAYIRHPAGVMAMGGDQAGGKSYFIFAGCFMAYFILSISDVEMKAVKATIIAIICVCFGDGLIALAGDYSASFSMAVLHVYSNSNLDVARAGDQAWDLSQVRAGQGFTLLGKALVYPCFTLLRPLLAFNPLKPWYPAAVLVGSAMVFISGYRSNIGYLAATFVVSAIVRRKMVDIFLVLLGGGTALALVLLSGQLRELPFGVQRVLSVLPVDVSSEARLDAENSTTWRVEMWELALTTDRYIHDKLLGDGFGISAHEMQAKLNAQLGLENFDIQDQMLSTGTFHGFHVETIRFTGVVGLLFAIAGMIILFKKAWDLLAYYRDRPEFGYLAYIFIPFLIYPWWALLVFGSYRTDFPQYLAMAGMLKMIDKIRMREIAELRAAQPQTAMAPFRNRAPGGGRPALATQQS